MRFSLEHMYKLARSEDKEVRCLFDKDLASDTVANATKDTLVTVMSSIMDLDGYTTVSHFSGSPTLSPIPRPQCRSPLCPGNKDGMRRNPFNNKFLTIFLPTFLHGLDDKNAPTDAVPAN
jgi:hypothetical protein